VSKRKKFVFDFDGTITLPRVGDFEGFLTPLQPYFVRAGLVRPISWYFSKLTPNHLVMDWLRKVPSDRELILLTGRYADFRPVTCEYLAKHKIRYDSLIFNDFGVSDIEFKRDFAKVHQYDIELMVDNMSHIQKEVAKIIGERSKLWQEVIKSPVV
jgi:uncharacterized HAD superfamily protein